MGTYLSSSTLLFYSFLSQANVICIVYAVNNRNSIDKVCTVQILIGVISNGLQEYCNKSVAYRNSQIDVVACEIQNLGCNKIKYLSISGNQ